MYAKILQPLDMHGSQVDDVSVSNSLQPEPSTSCENHFLKCSNARYTLYNKTFLRIVAEVPKDQCPCLV